MPGDCGYAAREMSGRGGSILVTSAPRSRSVFVQCGPASTRVKSRTLRPCRGAFISVPLEDGGAGAGGGECGEATLLVGAGPHQVAHLRLLCIATSRATTR